jgi:hypothetical protein
LTSFNIAGATSTLTTAYLVSIDGIVQDPNNYTIASGIPYVFTMSSAVPSGSSIVIVSLNGVTGATGPSGGPVGATGDFGSTGATGSSGIAGDKYTTFSSTPLTIALGTQSLTVETGLALSIGQTIIIANGSSNKMEGTITSYNSLTGALVANVTTITGSGSFSSWSVSLSGAPGPAGATGATGPQGATGVFPTTNFGNVWSYTGDGSTTIFAITGGFSTQAAAYLVSIDGIYQKPANYTISGTTPRTLTFSTVPSGSEITIVSLSVA